LSYNWYWEIIKYKIVNKLDFKEVLETSLTKLNELKERMRDSISSIKLNNKTSFIIQKIIYLNENDYNFMDAEKLVFYNIDVDIDSNGIPDQWYDFLNLSYMQKLDTYTFQNTNSYIKSQNLILKSNTKYKLTIKSNILFENSIYINGVLRKQTLEKKNGEYTIKFETNDIENKKNLYIFYSNEDFISFEKIYIFEE
jgi:hypothetical protein